MKNRELKAEAGLINFEDFKPAKGYVLCLKSLPSDLEATNRFRWPEKGHVVAPDWDPKKECGNGLHAFLWGCGDSSVAYIKGDAKWLVLKVRAKDIVRLDGKVKFQEAEILFCGERDTAVSIVMHNAPAGTAVMFANITVGDGETAIGGDYAFLKGGDFSTVTGGYCATVIGGDYANVVGGDYATATGGENATVTGGNFTNVTGGNFATVTGGYRSNVTGGKYANVTGGYRSNVTGGKYATVTGGGFSTVTGGDCATVTGGECANVRGGKYANVTGGYYATVTGGDGANVTGGSFSTVTGGIGAEVSGGKDAELILEYIDNGKRKKKAVVVDGEKILPGVKYRLNDAHEFVPFEGR
jgi:hypothetical protein